AAVTVQQVATITVTPQNGPCPGTPRTFTITLNPASSVNDPTDLSVCGGVPVGVAFTGTSPSFSWTNSNPAIGLGASGSGNISFSSAAVTAQQVATITVTPTGACPGPAQTFSITVNPLPTVSQPTNVAACGGNPVTVSFTGTGGPTFSWTNSNPAIGLGASGSGNISFSSAAVTVQQVATITVTPQNGPCPGTPRTFTITLNPASSVNDPTDLSVCGGDPVSVNFAGLATSFSWTNNNPAIGLGASGTGNLSFNSAAVTATQTSTITVTPNGSCPGPAQSFTIVVKAKPAPPTATTTQFVLCEGQAMPTLTVMTTGGATVKWFDQAAGGNEKGSGLSFSPPNLTIPGMVSYFAEAQKDGCVSASRRAFTITVNALPMLELLDTTCAASALTYSVQVQTNAQGVTASTGIQGSVSGNVYTFSGIPINTSIVLTATSSANCTRQLTVIKKQCFCPNVSKPVSLGDKDICENMPIPLLKVQVADPVLETVDWYSASSGGNLLADSTTSYLPSGAGEYWAQSRYRSNAACINPSRTKVVLSIRSLPIVLAGDDRVVCSNQTINLSSALQGVTGGFWAASVPGGTFEPNASWPSAQIYHLPPNTAALYLVLSSDDPTGPCPAVSDTVNITVHPPIQATLMANQPVCNGEASGILSVVSNGGPLITGYQWNNGSSAATVIHLAAGNYSVTLTDENSCTVALSTMLSDPDLLSISGQITSAIDSSQTGQITVTVTGGVTPYNYQWFSNNSLLGGEISPTLDSLVPGSYRLVLTDNLGCTKEQVFMVGNISDAVEVEQARMLRFYPNPTDGLLYMQLDLPELSVVQVDVLNLAGQLTRQAFFGKINKAVKALDLSGLPDGVYILKVRIADHRPFYRKIILGK
ncbi:MAG: T9SS type A sorting domain-containing protein, partial [Saprospiraceae bacterium]